MLPHSTGVGKAIMADMDPARSSAPSSPAPACRPAPSTRITDPEAFAAELGRTRERGYALDEGEQEIGVRCVAVAVPDTPQPLALSVSGPLPRMTDDFVERATGPMHAAAAAISAEMRGSVG